MTNPSYVALSSSNSSFFLSSSLTQEIRKKELNEFIEYYMRRANRQSNQNHEGILNDMSSSMKELIQFKDSLTTDVLDNRELQALACKLQPLVKDKNTRVTNEYYNLDYWSSRFLISRMAILIKYAQLPEGIFDRIVNHVFKQYKPVEFGDDVANVYTRLYAGKLEKTHQEKIVSYMDNMLKKEPANFYAFARAFTDYPDLFLKEFSHPLTEEQFNFKCTRSPGIRSTL